MSQSYELALLLQIQEEFIQLLNNVPDISMYTKWNDVEQRLKDDPRYMMIREVMAYQDTKWFDSILRCEMWFIDYKLNIDVSIIATVANKM